MHQTCWSTQISYISCAFLDFSVIQRSSLLSTIALSNALHIIYAKIRKSLVCLVLLWQTKILSAPNVDDAFHICANIQFFFYSSLEYLLLFLTLLCQLFLLTFFSGKVDPLTLSRARQNKCDWESQPTRVSMSEPCWVTVNLTSVKRGEGLTGANRTLRRLRKTYFSAMDQ